MDTAPFTSDDLSRKRRRLLLWNMATWDVWVLTLIANMIDRDHRALPGIYENLLLVIQMVSWIGWVGAMIALARFQRVLKANRAQGLALFDELFIQHRFRAAWSALTAMLLCQMVIVLIGTFVSFQAAVGAMVSIFVGVTSFFAAFLILDRE